MANLAFFILWYVLHENILVGSYYKRDIVQITPNSIHRATHVLDSFDITGELTHNMWWYLNNKLLLYINDITEVFLYNWSIIEIFVYLLTKLAWNIYSDPNSTSENFWYDLIKFKLWIDAWLSILLRKQSGGFTFSCFKINVPR